MGQGNNSVGDSQDGAVQEEKIIAVLMEEYRTLRAEIAQRIGGRMQIPALLAAGAALLASFVSVSVRHPLRNPALYLSVIVLAGGVIYWLRTGWLNDRIGDHIASVEDEINRRAKRAYGHTTNLLTWESHRREERQQSIPKRIARWLQR